MKRDTTTKPDYSERCQVGVSTFEGQPLFNIYVRHETTLCPSVFLPIKTNARTSFQFNILLITRNPSLVIESSHAFIITSDILITQQWCDLYFERSKRNKLTMLRLLTRIQLDVWSTRKGEDKSDWKRTVRATKVWLKMKHGGWKIFSCVLERPPDSWVVGLGQCCFHSSCPAHAAMPIPYNNKHTHTYAAGAFRKKILPGTEHNSQCLFLWPQCTHLCTPDWPWGQISTHQFVATGAETLQICNLQRHNYFLQICTRVASRGGMQEAQNRRQPVRNCRRLDARMGRSSVPVHRTLSKVEIELKMWRSCPAQNLFASCEYFATLLFIGTIKFSGFTYTWKDILD